MALTIDVLDGYPSIFGVKKVVVATATFDSSYATGGEALAPGSLGLSAVDFVTVEPNDTVAGTLAFSYDYTNKKVIAYYPTGGGAVPSSLAAPAVTIPAGGTTMTASSATPNLTETAGQGVEVASATDLSTASVRVFAIGN